MLSIGGPERTVLALAFLLFSGAPGTEASLLRNGNFQDDWLTLLPENQNHHWCYSTGFVNRRDYNPDAWVLSGSWKCRNADGPRGSRRLFLEGPRSEASQRINWITVHDDRRRDGFPDAGGFPAPVLQRSLDPLALVRDLTLRVRVRGEDVPKDGARMELALAPPGPIAAGDPMGARLPPTISVSASLPPGTFAWQWVELRLPAAQWLKAAQEAAAKDPKEARLIEVSVWVKTDQLNMLQIVASCWRRAASTVTPSATPGTRRRRTRRARSGGTTRVCSSPSRRRPTLKAAASGPRLRTSPLATRRTSRTSIRASVSSAPTRSKPPL